jgi:4-hydroxybutyryl-CoA dehydratase/vinylacetyl-CoA-Delta-isomerase
MKNGAEFVASVGSLRRSVFVLGERVEDPTEHPILAPSLNALART